jgi:hypothetical protein
MEIGWTWLRCFLALGHSAWAENTNFALSMKVIMFLPTRDLWRIRCTCYWYSSEVATAPPELTPPVTSTVPFFSNGSACATRGASVPSVPMSVPLLGSKRSGQRVRTSFSRWRHFPPSRALRRSWAASPTLNSMHDAYFSPTVIALFDAPTVPSKSKYFDGEMT